jgi:endonuclease III
MARKPSTPDAPTKSRRETTEIMERLFEQHPNAFTELTFRTPFELLVATILSAQSTDRRVNETTPALFAKYPDANSLAQASHADLERAIKATGFFRQKSKALIGMSQALVAEHGGEVPKTMEALTSLPGVGRKTANVVLGHALGIDVGLAVDRHVLRVANRIGIARGATPEEVEAQLCAAMPRDRWTLTSDTLILHGRRICRPRPLCDQCAVVTQCDFARAWKSNPPRAPTPLFPVKKRATDKAERRVRAAASKTIGKRTAADSKLPGKRHSPR